MTRQENDKTRHDNDMVNKMNRQDSIMRRQENDKKMTRSCFFQESLVASEEQRIKETSVKESLEFQLERAVRELHQQAQVIDEHKHTSPNP